MTPHPTPELGARATPRGSSSDAGHRACVELRGALLLLLLAACGSGRPASTPERPECAEERMLAIQAGCVAREIQIGCDTDPVKLCPELVADCERRIDEWEHCR